MPQTTPGAGHATPPGPTFAVAFGGGGARGLAHIHVIRALDELGIRPVAIAGSSIGAMMGAAMAAGMRGSDIEDHARAVLSNRGEAMSRMWRSLPRSVGELVAGGIRLGQFDIGRILRAFMPEPVPQRIEDHARAVLSNRGEAMSRMWRSLPRSVGELVAGGIRLGQFDVGRILRAFMPDSVPERIEGMPIPLQVTATDFYGHDEHVFAEGDLFTALAASAALPAIFRPVSHEGRLLIDGGITNPVPFDLLHGRADIVIGVDVVGGPTGDARGRPSSLDLLMGASQIMMEAIVELKLRQTRPHILLRPPVAHFGVLDFLKVQRVLGETSPIRDELKREIDRTTELHLRRP